jgi:hypothetical protein
MFIYKASHDKKIIYIFFRIRRLVKFEVKKVKRTIIWNGVSTKLNTFHNEIGYLSLVPQLYGFLS